MRLRKRSRARSSHRDLRTYARSFRRGSRPRRLLLEPLEPRLLLDSVGPRILSYTPNEVRNDVFDHVDVTFNEPIDSTTFTVDDVDITGPGGFR